MKKDTYLIIASILISGFLITGALIYKTGLQSVGQNQPAKKQANQNQVELSSNLEEKVIPSAGVELPVRRGSLGKQLVEAGVIDSQKFEELYTEEGGLTNIVLVAITPLIFLTVITG
jgi:hypothetical protein